MKFTNHICLIFTLLLALILPMQAEAAPSFAAAVNFTTSSKPYSVTSADFNGDGKTDMAVANIGANTVSVLLGDGLGGFAAATNFAAGSSPRSVTSADFNGDGKADIASANNGGNVGVLLQLVADIASPTGTISINQAML